MKHFFQRLVLFVFSVIVITGILEVTYTYIYKSTTPRTKPAMLVQAQPSSSYGYAVFGSSRAYNHIDTPLIYSLTGIEGYNFAVPGSSLFDAYLSIKITVEKGLTKNVFLQVDDHWNNEEIEGITTAYWLPFINEPIINKAFPSEGNEKYNRIEWVPFYRYCKNNELIGIRELSLSIAGKKPRWSKNRGFEAVEGKMEKTSIQTNYQLEDRINPWVQKIIDICDENDVNLFFFTAPYYNNKADHKVFEQRLKNYKDFTSSISESQFFKDKSHLNQRGSQLFTKLFIKEYPLFERDE